LGLVTGEVKPSLKALLEEDVVGRDRLQIVVGCTHPWFEQPEVLVENLPNTTWVMRESGSGAQQIFEQALLGWGMELTQLQVVLVLSSSEMVKAVVEQGVGAAAIPELMVEKELKLGTLRAIQAIAQRGDQRNLLNIVQPILKLKHKQRFQTQTIHAFEQILLTHESNSTRSPIAESMAASFG
jgi:DNA-binding transcriptional LysR family regulator